MSGARITSSSLATMKAGGERIACLTCYDAAFTRVLESAGVEVLLVGDSLGMVLQGQRTTVPVTLDHMAYHAACVSRVAERALVMADLPFLSYATEDRALAAAERLMGEGGAAMVKLEGGGELARTVARLTRFGAPVCAHLGLLPQSVHQLGGYRYQGKDDAGAARIRDDALALQDAGASLLVLHDMLGLLSAKAPRFSKDFLAGPGEGPLSIAAAVRRYVAAVKSGEFPGPEHTLA
jgi:3-methyl-2-oxobutanoate hydroxymethyltransferase